MCAQTAPADVEGVREAMASFSTYQVPELKAFLGRCNLRVGGLKPDLVARVDWSLSNGLVSLETAFDYIDELKEDGEQHLFLFRLRNQHHAYREQLRDWATSGSA